MQKFSPRSKSTNVSPPHTASLSSSRETTSPAFTSKHPSTCAGCGCRRSSTPSRRSSRRDTSNSKSPNRNRVRIIALPSPHKSPTEGGALMLTPLTALAPLTPLPLRPIVKAEEEAGLGGGLGPGDQLCFLAGAQRGEV